MSQPAAARPTGAAAWIVLAAGVSAALHVGKLPPAIGALQASLGITLVQAGFLLSLVQLAAVIRTCRGSASLSAAGRALFAVSRARRASQNDADRLRKYLARFGLDWGALAG